MDLDRLRTTPLFAALDDDTAHLLLNGLQVRPAHRGDVLFAQGEPADHLWFLGEGRVKLTRVSTDGRETLLALLAPGEVFGETCLLEGTPRAATATAVIDSTVGVLDRDRVDLLIRAHPDVIPALLQVLARRLRTANELLAELTYRDVAARLAKALVELTEQFGRRCGRGIQVSHGLTQEELAQLVGASREAVNKALSDFSGRGWLRLQPRAVQVFDLDRLRRRARLITAVPPAPAPAVPGPVSATSRVARSVGPGTPRPGPERTFAGRPPADGTPAG